MISGADSFDVPELLEEYLKEEVVDLGLETGSVKESSGGSVKESSGGSVKEFKPWVCHETVGYSCFDTKCKLPLRWQRKRHFLCGKHFSAELENNLNFVVDYFESQLTLQQEVGYKSAIVVCACVFVCFF